MPTAQIERYGRCVRDDCRRKWHWRHLDKKPTTRSVMLDLDDAPKVIEPPVGYCPACGGPCKAEAGTFEELFFSVKRATAAAARDLMRPRSDAEIAAEGEAFERQDDFEGHMDDGEDDEEGDDVGL